MRKDLKKVVTERPRSGGRYKTPKGSKRALQRDGEDAPKREKIRVKWLDSWTTKEFTDVIGPLYKYLLKQVGRKWDAVYSEIARNLPKSSMQNLHIHTHIWQFVEKDVQIINGVACHRGHSDDGMPIQSYGRYAQLYINPVTGLLCKAKQRKPRKSQPEDPPGVKAYPGVQYHKIKGIWYEVRVRDYPKSFDGYPTFYNPGIKDEVLGRHYQDLAKLRYYYGGDYIAVSKRQLKKKEIRFNGLK